MGDRWLRDLRFCGPNVDADVDEEIAYHIEQSVARFRAHGLSESEARRAADEAFGDAAAVRRALRVHDRRRLRRDGRADMMHDFVADVRYGLRQLRMAPKFAIAVVLVLALGIGANTAVFSAVDAAFLRPLPFPSADRLVSLSGVNLPFLMAQGRPQTQAQLVDYQRDSTAFASVSAYATGGLNLTGGAEPARVSITYATDGFFATLGRGPELGRLPGAGDFVSGGPKVVVLSHALWQQQFAGDRRVLGRAVELNGNRYLVIGVMPSDFAFPSATALWIPLPLPLTFDVFDAFRNYIPSYFIARLAPGVTIAQATQHSLAIQRHFHPAKNTVWSAVAGPSAPPLVVPLQQSLVGERRTGLLILAASAGLLLLIACANVTNLLLTRASIRRREIAVRGVLGATRLRIIRQLTVESLMLAMIGAAVAVIVAVAALHILAAALPLNLRAIAPPAIDGRVLAFTLAIAVVTSVVVGVWPALSASTGDLGEAMKTAGAGGGGSRRRTMALRSVLAITEVSLALMLLIAAGLMLESLRGLMRTDAGLRVEHVVSARLVFGGSRYRSLSARAGFFDAVVSRLRATPGVNAAAGVSRLPMDGGTGISLRVGPADAPDDTTRQAAGAYLMATPGYFATMGIPLRGQDLPSIADSTRPVAVINRTLAKQLWPDGDALGRQLAIGPLRRTVIGIVGDVRMSELDRVADGQMYLPMAAEPQGYGALVVRGAADERLLIGALTAAVKAIDPRQPLYELSSMSDVVSATVAPRRTNTILLTVFGALAVLLSAVGVYAVLSYGVAQRTREIGIRVALGAQRREVLDLVMRQGTSFAVIGIAVGLAGAWALSKYVGSLLYLVSPHDPRVFAGSAIVLALIALGATLLPALRATRVDPIDALRQE